MCDLQDAMDLQFPEDVGNSLMKEEDPLGTVHKSEEKYQCVNHGKSIGCP